MKSLNSQKLRIKLTKKRQKKEEEEEEEYLVEEKEGEEGLEGVHGGLLKLRSEENCDDHGNWEKKGKEVKGRVSVEAEKCLPSTLLLPPLTPGNQRARVREIFPEN